MPRYTEDDVEVIDCAYQNNTMEEETEIDDEVNMDILRVLNSGEMVVGTKMVWTVILVMLWQILGR